MRELPDPVKERAANLLAESEYEYGQIAEMVGVDPKTLYRWRGQEKFQARISDIRRERAAEAKEFAIAQKTYRVRKLQRFHRQLESVIEARAADPGMAGIPGGETGMLVRKAIVSAGALVGYEYVADIGLVKELRGIQEQVAKELGQLVEKHEHKVRSLKDLTDDELRALAAEFSAPETGEAGDLSGDRAAEEAGG